MKNVSNSIDVYGWQIKEITFDDKFNIIKDLYEFKRATIHGSCIRNELYLIDETKGIHTSWSGWRICDLEPVYEDCEPYNSFAYGNGTIIMPNTEVRFAGYKTVTNESLKGYVESHKEECEKWLEEHIDLNEYKQRIEKIEKHRQEKWSHYYQLESKNKGEILEYYVENNYSDGYANITSTKHGFSFEFDDIILGDEKNSPLQSILMYMLLNKDMFKDFRELDKGFVFNNHYYESVDDIVKDIEYCIKEKRLHEKFMNEGLQAEDLVADYESGK